MTLWRKNGGAPEPLPQDDSDPQGSMWSDLVNNPAGREACGWAEAPPQPSYDPATQQIVWQGDDWVVEDLPPAPPPTLPPEIPMYKVKKYMALRKAQTDGAIDYHADVMAYINAMDEPARTLARIDFGPDPEQIGSPNLVTGSSLALGAKAAMSLSDDDYTAELLAANAMA